MELNKLEDLIVNWVAKDKEISTRKSEFNYLFLSDLHIAKGIDPFSQNDFRATLYFWSYGNSHD